MVLAVLFLDVLDHAVATFIVKVHVDIRHGDTLRIEEALEEEVVADRVQIRDAKAISGGAARGGSTARADGNAVALGPVDEVLDDEEIVREAHAGDGLQLEVEAGGLLLVQRLAVTLFRAVVAELAHVGHRLAELVAAVVPVLVVAALVDNVLVFIQPVVNLGEEVLRQLELRQDVVPVDGEFLHLVADLQGIGQHLRMVREERRHLLLTLEILLLGVAQTIGLVDELARIEADEAVVGGTVVLVDEMDVVRGDNLDAMLLGEFKEDGDILPLALPDVERNTRHLRLVVHHLEVVVLPEEAFVPFDGLRRGVQIPGEDVLRDLAGHAGGAADEVLVVFLQHLVADPRLAVVHTLDVARRNDLHQVPVAIVILGQEDEVVVALVGAVLDLMVVPARDIDFATDDGLDVRVLLGELEELLDAVHVSMVGDGQTGHAELFRPVEQVLDGGLAVQDGILGMYVQVNEGHNQRR